MKRPMISPIGIEIGSRWVRAAQLIRVAGPWRLHAAVELPRREGSSLDDETSRLAGVLERRGFHWNDVVVAVPPDRLLGAVLELPPRTSQAPVRQLASAEIGRMHRVDPSAMEVALWEIPASNRMANGCDYMVAACPHDTANQFMDSFEVAGLRVRALDLPQLATLRACAASIRPAPSMDAILEIGWDRCTILVVTDGVIAYERTLEGAEGKALVRCITERVRVDAHSVEDVLTASSHRNETIATEDAGATRELEIELRDFTTSHITALVEQLNTSFSYISRRYTDRDLGAVHLAGGFATLDGLAARVSTLGVEAKVVHARDVIELRAPHAGDPAGPGIIAAIGLAMHDEGAAA